METFKIAEIHGEKLDSLDGALWDHFLEAARSHPHQDALVSLWQTDPEDSGGSLDSNATGEKPSVPLRWTYEDMVRRTEALASSLQSRGCVAGMSLVVLLGNSAEWALFFWAAARLRMCFVPLDPRALSASNALEVAKILDQVKPDVLVVSDAKAAEGLAGMESAASARLRIQASPSDEPSPEGWLLLSDVRHSSPEKDTTTPLPSEPRNPELHDVALVIFTSGTTGTPKGCLHTSANLLSETNDYDFPDKLVDKWLVHTPVSHIFAIIHAVRAWRSGEPAVFASAFFDAQATLRALVSERCNFAAVVPTMLRALLAHPGFPGSKGALDLRYVTLGATTIAEADVRLCREALGAQKAIQGFGLSEGAPVASWQMRDPLLAAGGGWHPGVGRVLPGASVRVCAPGGGSRRPLAVNEVGEMHIGGTSVVRGYLGGVASDSFYDDEAGHWHVTGDQATIDEDGVLHILGRYKDLIIRAGENVAPLQIEKAISGIDGVTVSYFLYYVSHGRFFTDTLKAQVVGVPDDNAGEVPVAVVRMPTKAQVMQAASDMGQKYTLGGVYTLEDLGLKNFPVTRSGKVLKSDLKAAVVRARNLETVAFLAAGSRGKSSDEPAAILTPPHSRHGSDTEHEDPSHLVTELSAIVKNLTGTIPSPEVDLRTLMESLTMLQYSDMVLRKTGKKLHVSDLLRHPTLAQHAALLQHRKSNRHAALDMAVGKGVNGPELTGTTTSFSAEGVEDSVPVMTSEIHTAASRTLKKLHMDMSDIEEVYPVKANYQRLVSGQRPQTYCHRVIFSIGAATAVQTRKAVEVALASRPILRTILIAINAQSFYHIAIRNTAILDHILHHVEVPDDESFNILAQDDSAEAFHPSLSICMQAKIVTVRENGNVHLIMTYSHTVFDFLSIGSFHKDIGQLLSRSEPAAMTTVPATPFKFFSDLYHDYAESEPAKASVQAISHRLRGISKMQAALWPRQQAPGWMIGTDTAAADPELAQARKVVRERIWAASGQPWDEATAREFRYPRIARVVNLPDMKRLQADKGLHPQTVAAAALALFNCLQTGQPYAVFSTIDAGRSWPFVPPWMEPLLPSPTSVDGPTMEWVLNMIRVPDLDHHHRGASPSRGRRGSFPRGGERDQRGPETVGEFLGRIQAEQEATARHAHAPWDKVLETLGPEEGRVAVDAACRQTLNWDASLRWVNREQPGGTSLRLEARYDWPDW